MGRGKGLRERRKENAHRSERREAERDSSEAGRDKRERERERQGGSVRGSVVAMGMVVKQGKGREGRSMQTHHKLL